VDKSITFSQFNILASSCITSLGFDFNTSYASARAGLIRPSEFDFNTTDVNGEVQKLIGYQVPLVNNDFENDSRLIQLLSCSLKELKEQFSEFNENNFKCGIYVNIPSSLRCYQYLDDIDDNGTKDYLSKKLQSLGSEIDENNRFQRILSKAVMLSGFPFKFQKAQFSTQGNRGTFELLRTAQEDIENKVVDVVIVGGIDSLHTNDNYLWLQGLNRLKTAEQPAGLMCGEAGVLFLMTGMHNLPGVAILNGVSLASQERKDSLGFVADGTATFQSIQPFFNHIHTMDWVVANINGEVNKAREWGCATVKFNKTQHEFNPQIWLPVASFGESGDADFWLSLGCAVHACIRSYAPQNHAIVINYDVDNTTVSGLISKVER